MTPTPTENPVQGEVACPFCGEVAGDMNITASMVPGEKRHAWYCTACNAEGPLKYNAADAIAAWNRRASGVPAGEQTQHHLGNPAADDSLSDLRSAPRSEPCETHRHELPARLSDAQIERLAQTDTDLTDLNDMAELAGIAAAAKTCGESLAAIATFRKKTRASAIRAALAALGEGK